MAMGVRQGCPTSGFLFAIGFDPIFRWLQETIIPRNPDGLDFLQSAQCAYDDDLAVAASTVRDSMAALANTITAGFRWFPPIKFRLGFTLTKPKSFGTTKNRCTNDL